jgi:hypothetical protein
VDIEADIPILIDRLPKTTGLILDVGTGRGAMAENLAKKRISCCYSRIQ